MNTRRREFFPIQKIQQLIYSPAHLIRPNFTALKNIGQFILKTKSLRSKPRSNRKSFNVTYDRINEVHRRRRRWGATPCARLKRQTHWRNIEELHLIATLGGFLSRKGDGKPGAEAICSAFSA